ncbi:acyl-CoA thioesterase [Algoriphagus aquimarinus]|uniref:Acyl-CoA thioester hydrolase n=1 Tax=Algoriphagus aquimarinus TaxID=237018 RepID=A0A1I0Y016_9BACT|nr:thioesterase family protein [Algoriphagus aquimarinus]SFB06227.1 acyl-CoA thioester hydrolase [Algoriphagus aquimarinus]
MKYIEDVILVNIRFSEVDSLGIVWHGNYLKFFEDGRESLGLKYGMSYHDLYDNKLILPIVETNLKFKSVLKFGHVARLVTQLQFSKAAKVIYKYTVYNETTGKLAAVGETTQVFVNEEMELQLITPPVFEDWKAKQIWLEK